MKNLKYILAFVAMAGALFTACDDTDFTPGPEAEGAQIYFASETAQKEFVLGDETSITVPVMRIDATEAKTVSVMLDAGEAEGIFSAPASVTFAAGQTSVDWEIAIDRDAIEEGVEYPVSVMINDPEVTPYGKSQISFSVMIWPWVELGKGKYRDDYISSLFDCEHVEIDIKVHEHKTNKGIYMIEEMFGWPYLTEVFEASQAQLSGQFSYESTNIVIDATDPNNVVIDTQWTGIAEHTYDYGDFNIFSIAGGKLENGVITFPVKGLIIELTGSGAYYANKDGMFRIMLPGAEITDYALAAEYAGMKVAVDNTTSAMIDFAYGDDVQGIAYTFAAGDQEKNAAEYVEAMIAGTDENMAEVANFEVGAGSASIEAALETAGVYTVIAMPKDKNGEWVAAEAIAVSFYFPGLGAAESHPVEFEIYMGKVSENAPKYADAYPDWAAIYYEFIGKDIKAVRFSMQKAAIMAQVVDGSMGMTIEELLTDYGSELDADGIAEIAENGYYWNITINKEPETAYTFCVEATNIYGEKEIFFETYTTAAEPAADYTGDLKIGTYTMTYGEGDNASVSVFEVVATGTENEFLLKDFGIELGTAWYATYDPAANTLTCNGIEKDYESYGNQFGSMWGWFNKTKLWGLFLCSFASDESYGDDPCVITIDPTTKELNGLATDFAVQVYEMTDANGSGIAGFVGNYAVFVAGSTTFEFGAVDMAAPKPLNAFVPYRPGMQPKNNSAANVNRLQRMNTATVEKSNTSTPKAKTLAVKSTKCERQPREFGKAQLKETAVRAFTK